MFVLSTAKAPGDAKTNLYVCSNGPATTKFISKLISKQPPLCFLMVCWIPGLVPVHNMFKCKSRSKSTGKFITINIQNCLSKICKVERFLDPTLKNSLGFPLEALLFPRGESTIIHKSQFFCIVARTKILVTGVNIYTQCRES